LFIVSVAPFHTARQIRQFKVLLALAACSAARKSASLLFLVAKYNWWMALCGKDKICFCLWLMILPLTSTTIQDRHAL
jgi:hypothetical protein